MIHTGAGGRVSFRVNLDGHHKGERFKELDRGGPLCVTRLLNRGGEVNVLAEGVERGGTLLEEVDLEGDERLEEGVHEVRSHLHQQGNLVLEALIDGLVLPLCVPKLGFSLVLD